MSTGGSGKRINAPSDLDPCAVDEKLVCRFSIGLIYRSSTYPAAGIMDRNWPAPDARHDTVIN